MKKDKFQERNNLRMQGRLKSSPSQMFLGFFSSINSSEKKSWETSLFVVLVALMLLGCKEEENKVEKENESPNFLVIIADDAGWNDFSYHGSEIQTPNIDTLAQKGIQLERFYAAPTCSPSRAALLTGKPASRMGIVAPISDRSELSLPDSITTLPQALKERGYKTSIFGKWHLGLKPESGPGAYGFDYSYGFLHGQIDQYTHHYKNGDSSWYRNNEFIAEEGHATDLITAEALEWLEQEKDDSFFMQVAYSAPHFPLQEEDKWKEPYLEIIENESRRNYAAAMAHMDHSIGKILQALRDNDLERNTIVIFLSDNGAMESWDPDDQYDGKFDTHDVMGNNLPLRDWKNTNYEGAIRVPAIISWEGQLNNGRSEAYISAIDVMPTLLKLLGVASLPGTVEGMDVFPALKKSEDLPERNIYIRGHLQESLIRKPWKLIRTRYINDPAKYEIYQLEQDPEEKQDLATEEPEKLKELQEELEKEFSKDADEVNLELRQ